MITKEQYGPQAMKKVTAGLPRGTRLDLAMEMEMPYTKICNIWSGKTWNAEVVKKIERLKKKLS